MSSQLSLVHQVFAFPAGCVPGDLGIARMLSQGFLDGCRPGLDAQSSLTYGKSITDAKPAGARQQ